MIDELISACFSEFCEIAGDSPCGCDACPYGRTNDDCYAIYEHDKLTTLEKKGITPLKWIPVSERLPEPETEVLVLAECRCYSFRAKSVTTHHIVTTGMYEDGTKNTEDSSWWWEIDGFEYDEELDAYIIPEGWWEYKHYNGDDEHNHAIDDVVTHWMPLPEPPKEEKNNG